MTHNTTIIVFKFFMQQLVRSGGDHN